MLNYAVKRLALAVVIVSVAMFLLFSMIYLIPGDPAAVALGPRATEAMREALRIKMGLDQPVWVQFWNFFANAWTGDLGREVLSERPVAQVVMEQLPFTLALIAGGITCPWPWESRSDAGPRSSADLGRTASSVSCRLR